MSNSHYCRFIHPNSFFRCPDLPHARDDLIGRPSLQVLLLYFYFARHASCWHDRYAAAVQSENTPCESTKIDSKIDQRKGRPNPSRYENVRQVPQKGGGSRMKVRLIGYFVHDLGCFPVLWQEISNFSEFGKNSGQTNVEMRRHR